MLILRRSKLYFNSIWYRHCLWAAVHQSYCGSFLYFRLLECVVVVVVVMEKCLLKPTTQFRALLFVITRHNIFFFLTQLYHGSPRRNPPICRIQTKASLIDSCPMPSSQRWQDVLGSRVSMSPCNCTQRLHISSLTRIDLRLSQTPSLMYSNPRFWQAIWRFRNLQ
jgi:hypothetical protein